MTEKSKTTIFTLFHFIYPNPTGVPNNAHDFYPPLLPLYNLFLLLHFSIPNYIPSKVILFLPSLSLTHQHISHYAQTAEQALRLIHL